MAAETVVVGRHDAVVLLSLRVGRRTSLFLIPVGVGVALAAGVSQARLGTQFDTVSGWLHSLLSPLWVLAVAVLLRVAVASAAFVAALVAVRGGAYRMRSGPNPRGRWQRATDGLRVAGGLRALRWTFAVRAAAVDLAGTPGAGLKRLEQGLGAAIWVAWIVLVLTSAMARR